MAYRLMSRKLEENSQEILRLFELVFYDLVRQAWNIRQISDWWKDDDIAPVLKERDLNVPENHGKASLKSIYCKSLVQYLHLG